MHRQIRAIYENGVFRPLEPLEGLPEHADVRLRVEQVSVEGGRLSDFAGLWSADECEEIEARIETAFEQVDPHDW